MVTFEEIGGEDALWRDAVKEIRHGSGRWTEYVETIVKTGEKYYSVNWERGLTESQEDLYPEDDEEVIEVFPEKVLRVEIEQQYRENPAKDTPIITAKAIESLRALGLGDSVEAEMSQLREIAPEAGKIAEVLKKITVLREDPTFGAYILATEKFLSGIKQ